jgi:tetraacyldisaccharide 4'-kinase
MLHEPRFWWKEPGFAAALLAPAAAIYGRVAAQRLGRPGYRATIPVFCIGNPTLGGAGKTPAAIALAKMLERRGGKPVLLTRGYGGKVPGPVLADTNHRADEIGDEAILLAAAAPTVIAADRAAGAKFAAERGAGIVVMDDGFQNPSLAKDVSLLVIDAARGLGNGRVFPAGPLRAPIATQFAQADALLLVGEPNRALERGLALSGLPLLRAALVPDPDAIARLSGKRTLAFAGIGNPEKFFRTLKQNGIPPAQTRSFPDHHAYRARDAAGLLDIARRDELQLVTTEKDAARLRGEPALAGLAESIEVLPVEMRFEDDAAIARLLDTAFARTS